MSALTFAFDQAEINDLINQASPSQNILVSILSAKQDPGAKTNLFLAAQLGNPKTNAAVTKGNTKPPVGCPVPPGWSQLVPAITHSQLKGLPKFIIPAANKAMLVNGFAIKGEQLFADLESFKDGDTQQPRLSFKKTANNLTAIAVTGEIL